MFQYLIIGGLLFLICMLMVRLKEMTEEIAEMKAVIYSLEIRTLRIKDKVEELRC